MQRPADLWIRQLEFPTNLLSSLSGLGQVHRGTPWQTVYLKDADLTKSYIINGNGTRNFVGTNTWMQWTGDFDANDATLMAPITDWHLAGLLMALLNTNDATRLLPVNAQHITDWGNVLNGLIAYSNSTAFVFSTVTPIFDTYVISSNSPQVLVIVNWPKRHQRRAREHEPVSIPVLHPRWRHFGGTGALGKIAVPQPRRHRLWPAADELRHPGLGLRGDSRPTVAAAASGFHWHADADEWRLEPVFSGADGYDYVLQTSADS